MFNGFSPRTIDFMWNIRLNNNKAWFTEHKDEYINDFYEPMKALGKEVFELMLKDFPNHGFINKVSRIYKDARRVRDGNPYRENLWFSVEKPVEGEWTSSPVFWFELMPENWSYGLGFYAAKAVTMAKLRARIDRNPKKFEAFITPLEKQNEFVINGDEYARKKTPPSDKTADWYNRKTISLIHWHKNGKELYSRDLVKRISDGFKFLMPYYDYFITIDNDPEPKK